MIQFIYGMNTMGFLLAGAFFLRFWRKSRDDLFLAFSGAFMLFAIDEFFHAITAASQFGVWAFSFRLAGFGLLIFAILRKNLK
ncbi:MAG TPA: DUF5985 family protein [Xanthobacteraceae bacterium]|nr:DUF5985 family protein [Xanthobacteraceae bacterium]